MKRTVALLASLIAAPLLSSVMISPGLGGTHVAVASDEQNPRQAALCAAVSFAELQAWPSIRFVFEEAQGASYRVVFKRAEGDYREDMALSEAEEAFSCDS